MIRGLDHVGLRCTQLVRSLAFYHGLLGIPIREQGTLENGSGARIMDMPGLVASYADLDLGGGHTLELIELPPATEQAHRPRPWTTHVSLAVADAWAAHDRLVEAGVMVVSSPVTITEPGFWQAAVAFYATDPDGHTVELIQWPRDGS